MDYDFEVCRFGTPLPPGWLALARVETAMLLSTHIAAVIDITSLHALTAHTDSESSELFLTH